MKSHTATTVDQTHQIAKDITHQILTHQIPPTILLSGELGGGKTTFTQGIGQALGLNHPLPSPTYTIIRPYDIPPSDTHPYTKLIHTDLYRLKAPWEAEELELIQYTQNSSTILVVEWPEKAPQLWNQIPHTLITFTLTKDHHRIIQITSY